MGAAAVLEMMAATPLRPKFSANPNFRVFFLSDIVSVGEERKREGEMALHRVRVFKRGVLRGRYLALHRTMGYFCCR